MGKNYWKMRRSSRHADVPLSGKWLVYFPSSSYPKN
jgi:hypothetical protein